MFKLFTRGWFLTLMAIALLSVAIWFGGPYVAFGSAKPLESTVGRLVAILVIVVLWTLWVQIRQARAQRAGAQLARDVSRPDVKAAGRQTPESSTEAAQLRARFEEAVAALRSSKGGAVNLYELPWYIIIGPPGAGKTTAIANSGLNFPLSKKFGKEALRGVGGTRNCDWWFTNEAILLDTAGRYTTQDSDSESDHAGWIEFLKLLCRHRARRPVNGVIVAMSASDLMALSESERARHVTAIRNRLQELARELRISLPVYFFVTKMDLIAGFTEFFDDLTQEGRSQVWGATFPIEQSRSGASASSLPDELTTLLERLNSRVMLRIEAERDVRRRGLIFTFPRQFAALRRPLAELVEEVFAEGDLAKRIQLRGVYFTSGTQEGTPIDRMMGALARTFGLNVKGTGVQSSQGRAYFIQRLLKEILFKESGLAGVNRGLEIRQALTQGVVYVGVAAIAALGIIAFSVSYSRNRAYLETVATAAKPLEALPAPAQDEPFARALVKLDALNDVVTAARVHEGNVPFTMRFGLYQGNSITNAAHDAYVRELNAELLPAVADHFRKRLLGFAGEPDRLYEYLKAYLMLGMPEHLDAAQLGYLANLEWQRAFADDPAMGERVATHFKALIDDPSRMQPAQLDEATVQQARTSLQQASLPVLMYSRLKLAYVGDSEHALDIGNEIGLGGDTLFVRRSGASLSEPFPALFTKKVFDEVSTTGQLTLVKQFLSESWVLGGGIAELAKSARFGSEVMDLYEDDYIRAWDALLADLALKRASSATEATELWGLLAAPTSPLKRLLVLVEANTNLLKTPPKADAETQAKKTLAGGLGAIEGLFNKDKKAVVSAKPGAKVTRHFETINKLVAGSPALIDLTLQKFGAVQVTMSEINALGGPPPLELASRLSLALKDLDAHAKTLPQPLDAIVARTTGEGTSAVKQTIASDLSSRYAQQVVSECRELAAGRYPITRGSAVDLPVADFGRLFGPGGVYEAFFKETMVALVDANRATWAWKPEAASIGGSRGIPTQFQRADRIKQTFFPPGSGNPEVRFSLTPAYLDAEVARMVVEIDGQPLEYRHGGQRTMAMTWPGPSPGQASISLEERSGAKHNLVEQGSWAFYRLLEKASIQAQSDTTFQLTFNVEGRSTRLVLQASSSRNPFGRNVLQGFSCSN